jgi:hypothetical protein
MQRILVVLVILAVGIRGLAALWIFRGMKFHHSLIVTSQWKPDPRRSNLLHMKAVGRHVHLRWRQFQSE